MFYYKMFREMRAAWLVRTSSFYFHKARTLRHTSALLKYNSRSLRHRNERAQFIIPIMKEIKNLFPRALLSFISTREFLRTLEKCEMNILWLVLLRTSLVFLKIPACLYHSTMHSMRFLFLYYIYHEALTRYWLDVVKKGLTCYPSWVDF